MHWLSVLQTMGLHQRDEDHRDYSISSISTWYIFSAKILNLKNTRGRCSTAVCSNKEQLLRSVLEQTNKRTCRAPLVPLSGLVWFGRVCFPLGRNLMGSFTSTYDPHVSFFLLRMYTWPFSPSRVHSFLRSFVHKYSSFPSDALLTLGIHFDCQYHNSNIPSMTSVLR